MVSLFNELWRIDCGNSLAPLYHLDLGLQLFLVVIIIRLLILDILICRVHGRSLVRSHDEAGKLDVSLLLIGVAWVENANPLLVELVIQVSVKSTQAHTILTNKFVLKNWVMIVKFKYQFESF